MVDYAQHWSQRCQRGPFINYSANHTNAVSQHFYCLQNSSIRANRFSKSLEFVIGDIFNHSSDCFPDILFGLPAIPPQFYIKRGEKKGPESLKKNKSSAIWGVLWQGPPSGKVLFKLRYIYMQLNSVPYFTESLVWQLEPLFFGKL